MASDTDTEVVAHLLEERLETGVDLAVAMRQVCSDLEGAFTLVAVDAAGPRPRGRRPAATRPLVVGLGEGENFLGSDVAAFIEHTREAMELDQDQVVEITRECGQRHRLRRHAGRGPPLPRRLGPVRRGEGRLRLLHAQGDRRAAARRRRHAARPPRRRRAAPARRDAAVATRTCATSTRSSSSRCGTSYHAGLVGEVRDRALDAASRCEVELASEFRYRDPILDRDTLVIAISQSGETADTLEALRHAREQGPRCWRSATPTARRSRASPTRVIYTHAGPEIGVASTKAFLTQLVACYLVGALPRAGARHAATATRSSQVIDELDEMPDHDRRGARRVRGGPQARARASSAAEAVLFLGRHVGLSRGARGRAQAQGARLHPRRGLRRRRAQARPDRADRGGPARSSCSCRRAVATSSTTRWSANIQEIRARGARTIVHRRGGRHRDRAVRRRADPRCPQVPMLLQPLVAIVPLQVFACELATPARPRRRPAAQPRQVRHGRVARCADHRRRHRRGRHRALRAVPRAHAGAAGAAVHRGRGSPPGARRWPPGSRPRRRSPRRSGAPAGWPGTTPRSSRRTTGRPRFELPRHRRGRAPSELGVAHVHLSLSHDAGIASAVVVPES